MLKVSLSLLHYFLVIFSLGGSLVVVVNFEKLTRFVYSRKVDWDNKKLHRNKPYNIQVIT